MFDALPDPLGVVIVLLIIAVVVVAGRWGRTSAPPDTNATASAGDRADPPARGA